MKWRKLGRVYQPQTTSPYLLSHAANPLAMPLGQDLYRVFYSGRDAYNRSSVSYIDLDVVRQTVVYVHPEPIFKFGAKESFYADGVSIGCVYQLDGQERMLFMGWHCPQGKHWRGEIGALVLRNKQELEIDGTLPIVMHTDQDEISLSYPWVMFDDDIYKMWYGSTVTWDAGNGEMLHVIRYATSQDGKIWQKHGQAIPHEIGITQAFSRPTVVKDRHGFHMWFSYRGAHGSKYRIGYASSPDGENWSGVRRDCGIDVSDSGWDSEMIEYPFVFDHAGKRLMLYNGNAYGATGFGLAMLETTGN